MDILLVEDSSADAYLLTEVFTRKESGAEIHWVTDGYHALDYVHQRRAYEHVRQPDLILLDLNLPRINGYEVLKELKENGALSHIPVVILTTSRDPLDHSQCKALGADICLSKPHGIKEYEEMVQKMINWVALRVDKKPVGNGTVH
jgi:CheY-like chemotaxis protein